MIDLLGWLISSLVFWTVLSRSAGPRRHQWHEISSIELATAHRRALNPMTIGRKAGLR